MKDRLHIRGIVLTIATCVALLALLLAGVNQIDTRSSNEQAASLKAAVLRAVVTCYAVEGRYPADVTYLQAHYGLTYNQQRFIVSLESFAENLLPDIAVLAKGDV